MDYSSFSHGQIQSKLWLCCELEKFIEPDSNVVILGSWYNILGFMMLARNPQLYNHITGIDNNRDSIEIADKVCNAWMINDDHKIKNLEGDVNQVDCSDFDVIICTSVEDIENTEWFNNIPSNKLVCLQALNLDATQTEKYQDWIIKNPIANKDILKEKFPINQILFEDQKEFDYGDLKYTRFMLIGKK
jgi:hypothetical protein